MSLLKKLPLAAKKQILKRLLSQYDTQRLGQQQREVDQQTPLWSPVSSGQAGIYVASSLDTANIPFNTFFAFRIRSAVNEALFTKALRRVIDSHPSLRAHYRQTTQHVEMQVLTDYKLDFDVVSHSDLDAATLGNIAADFYAGSFDLENNLPIRARLYRVSNSEYVFVLSVHHIAYDGWSMWLLLDELANHYGSLSNGGASVSNQKVLKFTPYRAEDSIRKQGELTAEAQSGTCAHFWRQHLAHAKPIKWVGEQTSSAIESTGSAYNFSLDAELVEAMQTAARSLGVTNYAFMFAVYAQLLKNRSGQQRFVVSTMGAGSLRSDPDYEERIGYFANLLPIHIELNEQDGFATIAKNLQASALEAMENQDYPIQHILEDYRRQGGKDVHLLTKTAFFFQRPQRRPELAGFMTPGLGADDYTVDFGGLSVSPFFVPFRANRFDFCLDIYASDADISAQIQFKPALFSLEFVKRFSIEFVEQLTATIHAMNHKVPDIAQAPVDFSRLDGELLAIPDGHLMGFFEKAVHDFPDRNAVTCDGLTLTYKELDQRVRSVHKYLLDQGVCANALVGLAAERSIEMVVGLLAICRAGATYLPLDIQFPDSRLEYIICDAGCQHILTSRELGHRFTQTTLLYFDDIDLNNWQQAAELAPVFVDGKSPAYLIYTSGSTGNPKGVVVPHQALLNFLLGINQHLGLSSADTLLAVTTLSFDIAALEMFLPLIKGAHIVVATQKQQSNGLLLTELLDQYAVSFMQATPSTWRLLQANDWRGRPGLSILCGGEALPASLANYLVDKCRHCFNVYGPTETTIWSTIFEVGNDGSINGASVPVGRPLPNQCIYILDEKLAAVEPGQVGEIVIGGQGVTLGYHQRPELTEEKFPLDPFSNSTDAHMYRTGDLGRINDQGLLEYAGRADNQIKLRGYRIEPGEIEAAIDQHPGVVESVVVVSEKQEQSSLCAFVIADEGAFQNWKREDALRAQNAVDNWRDIWDLNYDVNHDAHSAGAVIDPYFDISGWRDTYDRQPISEDHMRQWRNQIVARIQSTKPQRILEVGFGTGLLLFAIAPDCEYYHGVDLSNNAVHRMRSLVDKDPALCNKVHVQQGQADAFDVFPESSYDLIIINSVAQYFPDEAYLQRVLSGWLSRLQPAGRIFCGDIRNLNTLNDFHLSVQLHRGSDPQTLEGLDELCRQETELVIDPSFFWTVPLAGSSGQQERHYAHARVELKHGPGNKELVNFRFDAWLENRPQAQTHNIHWTPFRPELHSIESINDLLNAHKGELFGIKGIPDLRLQAERDWLNLKQPQSSQVSPSAGLTPQSLYELAHAIGCRVFVGGPNAGRNGCFDAVFDLAGAYSDNNWPSWFIPESISQNELSLLTNEPARIRFEEALANTIRSELKQTLPAYMRPTKLLFRRRFPMTLNGKIDRKTLTSAASAAPSRQPKAQPTDHQAASNSLGNVASQVKQIWCRLLDVDQLGEQENFFDSGGTSLLAVSVHKALEEAFAQSFPALLLFEYPTIASAAAFIAAQMASANAAAAIPIATPLPAEKTEPKVDDNAQKIAVIAMAGRFPGADSVGEFWQNLVEGKEGLKRFSEDELRQAGISESLLQNKDYVPARGVLNGVDQFDAELFGYSAREATITDPQQRLFLECAWQALETAGYDPQRTDSKIGVFAGAAQNRYGPSLSPEWVRHDDPIESYQYMIASDKDYLATRVSYKLNLKGPGLSVQTACSTSLVAVHLACRSILNGECDMALAGGVAVHLPHNAGYEYRESMILSPDGHCRPFSASAQGTVPGSGVGAVVLKRLDKAIADGDEIDGVIAGSAVNNDGDQKVGYTAPSVSGQANVIRDALADANVNAHDIGYVEAHGTATEVGDPIEFEALNRVLNDNRPSNSKDCAIGALKSNVGHLDAAAGVAGLIKAICTVKSGTVPPTLHFDRPNTRLQLDATPFFINNQAVEWPHSGELRRAGVSSFGIGGSNAHVIVEAYHKPQQNRSKSSHQQAHVLCLSANNPVALRALVERYLIFFTQQITAQKQDDLADICFTANMGRKQLGSRVFFLGTSHESFANSLEAFLNRNDTISQPLNASPQTTGKLRISIDDNIGVDPGNLIFPQTITEQHRHRLLEKAQALGLNLTDSEITTLTYWQIFTSLGLAITLGEVQNKWLRLAQPLDLLAHWDQQDNDADVIAELMMTPQGCTLETLTGDAIDFEPLQVDNGWGQLLLLCAEQWSNNTAINWAAITMMENRRRVRLPTYPFQTRRYWGIQDSARENAKDLVAQKATSRPQMQWQLEPGGEFAFDDHRVAGKPVVPGAFFVEMIRRQLTQTSSNLSRKPALIKEDTLIENDTSTKKVALIKNVLFLRPCLLGKAGIAVHLQFEQSDAGQSRFEAHWPISTEHKEQQIGMAADGHLVDLDSVVTQIPANALDTAKARLKGKRVSLIRFWQQCKALDIEYGPEYRRLKELWAADNEAIGLVSFKSASASRQDIIGLDACLQAIGAALPQQLRQTPLLPASIDSVALWGAANKVWTHVRCVGEQADKGDVAIFDINLFDDQTGKAIGMIKGLRLREVIGVNKQSSRPAWADWAYQVAWHKHALLPVEKSVLPSPHQALSGGQFVVDSKAEAEEYAAAINELDELVISAVRTAFCNAQWCWHQGDVINLDQVMDTLQLDVSQRRYIEQLLHMLASSGELAAQSNGWLVRDNFFATDIHAELDWLLSEFPIIKHEVELVRRVSKGLDLSLKGEVSFLDLLFENGDLNLLRDFYTDSYSATSANRWLAQALHKLTDSHKFEGPIAALEIGGGTGATSHYTVPVLLGSNDKNGYCFTDLVSSFTTSAQSRFADYKGFATRILNIEENPLEQEFSEYSYDLVISTNAIHATRNLAETLAHVKKILKPGGWLCLIESTRQHRWVDLTFGGTEGWWRFNDTHIRKDHPLLTESDWLNVLSESGFGVKPEQQFTVADEAVGQSLILVQLSEETSNQVQCSGIHLSEDESLPAADWPNQSWIDIRSANHFIDALPRHDRQTPCVLLVPRKPVQTPMELWLSEQYDRVVKLLHQFLDHQHLRNRKLAVVTHGAQAVTAQDDPDPVSTALTGLVQVAVNECEELNIRLFDLPETPQSKDYQCLANAIGQWSDEQSVAIRDGDLLNPRLEKQAIDKQMPLKLDPSATYLITGGTGALGLLTARCLADNGARHIHLVARGNTEPDAQLINQLRSQGVTVELKQADISQEQAVLKLMDEVNQCGRRLAGVIHAAGYLEDGAVLNYDRDRTFRVIGPKALGVWYLHQATKHHSLDFFLTYSSFAALFAFSGQSSHTAANRFMDALMQSRVQQGLPGASINWGTWGQVGSAASYVNDNEGHAMGIRAMSPALAIDVVAPILTSGHKHLGVFDISWPDHFRQGATQSIFAAFDSEPKSKLDPKPKSLQKTLGPTGDTTTNNTVKTIKQQPDAAQSSDNNAVVAQVKQQIVAVVARILGVPVDSVHNDKGFFESGLDSLAAINLRRELEVIFDASLPSTIVFRYTTVNALLEYYIESQGIDMPKPQPSSPQAPKTNGSALQVQDHSVDELAALLQNELNNLSVH